MKRKCFIASPFFCPEEVERIDKIQKLLTDHGFDFFSAKEECYFQPDAEGKISETDKRNVFKNDCAGIDSSDFMIVIGGSRIHTDPDNPYKGYDTGTFIEMGYALARRMPIIYFNESNDGLKRNLMVAGAAHFYARTFDDLVTIISLMDQSYGEDVE